MSLLSCDTKATKQKSEFKQHKLSLLCHFGKSIQSNKLRAPKINYIYVRRKSKWAQISKHL